jgi:hypothetical protein
MENQTNDPTLRNQAKSDPPTGIGGGGGIPEPERDPPTGTGGGGGVPTPESDPPTGTGGGGGR